MLPTFLIIGAQKAGTTSLQDVLQEHPAVGSPFKKEPAYLTHFMHRPLRWYRSHFPLYAEAARIKRRLGVPMQVGEATPYYLFHPTASIRARALIPDAKLVAILRNPIDRAHSQHNHEVVLGYEHLPFEEALAAEEDRLAGEEERLARNVLATSEAHAHYSYASRGRYAEQLERWQAAFGAERLLVLISEEFWADPAGEAVKVQEFLGLPPQAPTDVSPRNIRRYDGLSPALRARLAAVFADDNDRLAHRLGRHLPWD